MEGQLNGGATARRGDPMEGQLCGGAAAWKGDPMEGRPHGGATPWRGTHSSWTTKDPNQPLGGCGGRAELRGGGFARRALACSCCKALTKAFFSLLVCSAFSAFFWLDVMHCSQRIFPFFSCFQCGVKSVRH